MRKSALHSYAALRPCEALRPVHRACRRYIQIHAVPASSSPTSASINLPDPAESSQATPDARFEVIGSPFSLLSASVSASQPLFTRKGTLVGFNGKPEGAVSTLSVLEPFRRAVSGVPFLYQKISATSPFTALISTRSPLTTFAVLHLDGRVDWMIAQRNALLAWTGHTLSLKPQINARLSLAHWGSTRVTGRGLMCVSGRGQVYQIVVRAGEEYIVHPSNVVAYSLNASAPQPYRFRSSTLRFQIPNPASLLPDLPVLRAIRASQAYNFLAAFLRTARTFARRSLFADRLFLRFEGPTNILLQARGASIPDVLSARDVDEFADAPAGVARTSPVAESKAQLVAQADGASVVTPPRSEGAAENTATVGPDGKVTFGTGRA